MKTTCCCLLTHMYIVFKSDAFLNIFLCLVLIAFRCFYLWSLCQQVTEITFFRYNVKDLPRGVGVGPIGLVCGFSNRAVKMHCSYIISYYCIFLYFFFLF